MTKLISDVSYHIGVYVSIITYDGIWLHSITVDIPTIVDTSMDKIHGRSISSEPVTLYTGCTHVLTKDFIFWRDRI